jgi:hypothetical protein
VVLTRAMVQLVDLVAKAISLKIVIDCMLSRVVIIIDGEGDIDRE